MLNSAAIALAPKDVQDACSTLSIAFANAVDHRDYERALSVFTEDGVFERWDAVYEGRDKIGKMMNARDPNAQTRHLCTNIEIRQSPEETQSATGVTFFMFYKESGSVAEQPLSTVGATMVGEFHDHYGLTEDGWRILRRKVIPVFQHP